MSIGCNGKASLAPEPAAFAVLVPLSQNARRALDELATGDYSTYHKSFLGVIQFYEEQVHCFKLSLDKLPAFPNLGWRIGSGKNNQKGSTPIPNRGVDLLLPRTGPHGISSFHARFNWVAGMGGLFILANRSVMVDSQFLSEGRQAIHYKNTIMLGDCTFTLQYARHSRVAEIVHQHKLRRFLAQHLHAPNALVIPTPTGQQKVFGEWMVQWPIAKGGFGSVYMVTHYKDGRPAAAKHLSESGKRKAVTKEIAMAKHIATLPHNRIASPIEIIGHETQNSAETTRLTTLFGEDINIGGRIRKEWTVITPFMNATLETIIAATPAEIPLAVRQQFFIQLLDAVSHLHENKIAHRDIKPANILVKQVDDPELLLTDFGLSYIFTSQSRIPYDGSGTVLYMAPEQRPGYYHGVEVDNWACGLVGAELLGLQHKERIITEEAAQEFRKLSTTIQCTMATCIRSLIEIKTSDRCTANGNFKILSSNRSWDILRLAQHHRLKSTKQSGHPSYEVTYSGTDLASSTTL